MNEENKKEVDLVKERETLFNVAAVAGLPEGHDNENIKEFLKSKAGQRMLCSILLESDAKLAVLGAADLMSDEGVKKSIKEQGYVQGLARAVDIILEAAFPEPEQPEEGDE